LEKTETNPCLKEVLLEEATLFLQGKKTNDLNEEFLKSNGSIRAKIIGNLINLIILVFEM